MNPQKEEAKNEPLCISIPATAKLLGVSRGTAYTMARMGQIPTIRCGKRRKLVPVASLRGMLEGTTNMINAPNKL